MFGFTAPTDDIVEANSYDHKENVHWFQWRTGGLSANSYWLVNSACDEWLGFRNDIVPMIEDPEAPLGRTYDHENEYTEYIWIKKDELLQFISCMSIADRMRSIVRTNRFEFTMDRETGEFCQLVREIPSKSEIYFIDRRDVFVLWTLVSTAWDWETAEKVANTKDFHKTRGYLGATYFPLVLYMTKRSYSTVDHAFCPECNTMIEGDYLEFLFVEGKCYECREKEKAT